MIYTMPKVALRPIFIINRFGTPCTGGLCACQQRFTLVAETDHEKSQSGSNQDADDHAFEIVWDENAKGERRNK